MDLKSILAEDFKEDVKKVVPWAQIVNVPNLDPVLIKQINPAHGLFVNENNAQLLGIEKPEGWTEHEQSFRGEEVVNGYITNKIRFLCLRTSPVVVTEEGQIVGFMYDQSKKGLSEVGLKAKENPAAFRRKSWWLIVLLDKGNKPISAPIRLALASATGTAFNQERVKDNEEITAGFFKALGVPKESLNETAYSFFVHDWVLGPYRSGTNAPYEVPIKKLGPIDKTKSIARYKSGDKTRNIEIVSTPVEELIITKRSPLGEKIIQWKKDYENVFDFIKAAPKATKDNNAPELALDAPEFPELDDDLPF